MNIDHDTNGDGLPEGAQNYSQWTAIVSANRNSTLLPKNASFHQAYDNLILADPSVQFYRVVGDKSNTIVQIREYIKCLFGNFNCEVKYELIMGNGDGTVPLHSADLYNPDTGFDYRTGITNYYAHKITHASLPGNECILNMILAFIEDLPASCADTTTSIFKMATPAVFATSINNTPEPFSGIELETLGPVQGVIHDEAGNLLGLSTGLDPNPIPGGVYNAISDTQSFFLNQNGNYVALLNVAGTEPITLRMRTYANDAMNGQAVFNINTPINSRLQIAFNNGDDLSGLQLQIDTNADGLFDETFSPDSYYPGSAASETIPPTTTMSLHWVSPQAAEITLTANDQPGGTGVAHTYYRILNSTNPEITVYTSPFNIPPGTELQFFSDDRVGNTERIQNIQTALLDIKPGGFPNSINLQSNGTTPVVIFSTPSFDATSVSTRTTPPLDDVPDLSGLITQDNAVNINLRYFINPSNDEDWFRFYLSNTGSPQIHLTSLPANYDLYVYNSAGQLIGSSAKDKKAAEIVKLTNATSGYYYVRVICVNGAWNGTNPYQLRFNVPGAP